MRLWRISNFADLSGRGGLTEPGRWHSIRRPIVYLSDHSASALLEILMHLEVAAEDLPDPFQLLSIEVSDDVVFDTIEPEKLPHQWRFDPATTQAIGNGWLTASQTALLRIPSAIVPFAWNWLLNPTHRDTTRSKVIDTRRVAFDARLFG